MSRIGMTLAAAAALALVITALTLPNRQTIGVVNAMAEGASRLAEASLGQMPTGRR